MSAFESVSISDFHTCFNMEIYMKQLTRIAPILLLVLGACSDVEKGADGEDGHHHHDHEVITTVILNFAADSGDDVSATWTDISGEAVIDDIVLSDETDYTLTFEILNELEETPEPVHEEIADEDDEHQVFIQGSAVEGPATGENADAIVEHAYADEDINGLPIGLTNDIVTLGTGSGDFKVTLRHMPLQNGETIKTEGAAEEVAANGLGAIGGDNDFSLEFSLTVE